MDDYTAASLLPFPLCFCNSNRAWGGGERWHLESALHFARSGNTVTLACLPGAPLWCAAQDALQRASDLAPYLRIVPWACGNISFANPFTVKRFACLVAQARVCRIIANLPSDMKVAVMALRWLRSRLLRATGELKLYYRRGSALPVRYTVANRFFYAGLDGLIANSNETARLVNAGGPLLPDSKIHVIYNGIDAVRFDAAMTAVVPATARTESSSMLTLGNAGRLNEQKGQKYLLHMSASLVKHQVPHRLIIAGTGELLDELQALAHALGLPVRSPDDMSLEFSGINPRQSGVYFTGFMHDLSPFWHQLDLFVLSSLWEGFGFVLAEAMLARVPLLAFNTNSMPELVTDGVNGRLVDAPLTSESDEAVGERLAQAVIVMARDPEQLKRMGNAGREECLRRFSHTASMCALENLLRV